MCTAIIVVSLPGFKVLIMQSVTENTSDRTTDRYYPGSRKTFSRLETPKSHGLAGNSGDDDIELIFQESKQVNGNHS
jgi:hypothetical protein